MRPMPPAPANFSSDTPAGYFRERYRPHLDVLFRSRAHDRHFHCAVSSYSSGHHVVGDSIFFLLSGLLPCDLAGRLVRWKPARVGEFLHSTIDCASSFAGGFISPFLQCDGRHTANFRASSPSISPPTLRKKSSYARAIPRNRDASMNCDSIFTPPRT